MARSQHRRGPSNRTLVRRATNQYWVDSNPQTLTQTVTGGAPVATNIITALAADYQALPKGATIMTVRGSISAVVTTVAANTDSTLLAGLVVQATSSTAATLDPTTTTGRTQPWMWQTEWHWPMTAGSFVAGGVAEARRELEVESKRIIPTNNDCLWLVLGAMPTVSVQTWAVRWHFRTLIRVP